MWIFGYGSLIWRPGFDYDERRWGYIEGLTRRFWQGSPDHRGLPESPGRVATIIDDPGQVCWGMVYRLAESEAAKIVSRLDVREQGGYTQRALAVHTGEGSVTATVYAAGPSNPHWLGPASLPEMVAQISTCRGPSGANAEYLLELARSLRQMGTDDPHVFELERALKALPPKGPA